MVINSIKNDKIKRYLKLRDNSKFRKKENKFTIEGVRLIFEAVNSPIRIFNLFLTKECLEKISNERYDFSKRLNFFLITKEVAKKISLVENNQGAFAIAEKPHTFGKEEIERDDFVLALFKVREPGNLGSLFRSAFSFGFSKIILCNCCDIYNPKVIRSSMGFLFRLSFFDCEDFEELLNFLSTKKIKTFASVLKDETILSTDLNGKSGVLILGNEAFGLPPNLIAKCSKKVTIKISKNCESLNVASAGSILMYEMKKNNYSKKG